MRYFNRSPPCLTIPDRSSLILFAAPILSGMAIRQLSTISSQLSALSIAAISIITQALVPMRSSFAESR